MRRINLDDDFEDAYEDFDDDDYEDFEDDDDDDDDDDDYRANPESALASLMKLASEAMTERGMRGTIDVDFYTSEPKIKEWAALSNAEQLAPGVWFARYYAIFRYSRALWGKQTPAKRRAEVRGAFLTVAKLYLTEEQRAKASKPRKAPRAATKAATKAATNKQLKEGEIDHEIVARFRREAAAAEAAAKAPKTFKQPVSWFFKWKPKRGQPGGFNSVQAKTRLEALKKATALGKGRDGKTILTPDAASLQLDLDGRLARGAMSMFSD